MNNYETISQVGEGVYSTVFKVKRRIDGREYAMKKIKIMNFTEKQIASCLNQVRILASLSDPYILDYKDSFYDQSSQNFCIVTEYLDGGDLAQLITRHRESRKLMTETSIWRIIYQALKGLNTLHQMNILHRDIKPANLFFSLNSGMVKLGDLNLSIIGPFDSTKTQAGTPLYASPQVWQKKSYTSKCDIWSIGCLIYELAALRPPFEGQDSKSLKENIRIGAYKRIPLKYSDDLEKFISCCLSPNPNDRFSAKQLISSQILRKHIDDEYLNSHKNLVNCKLIGKILAPKKCNFRVIRNYLPKNRFELDRERINQEEDKQNKRSNNSQGGKLTFRNTVKLSFSLSNKVQNIKQKLIPSSVGAPKLPRF